MSAACLGKLVLEGASSISFVQCMSWPAAPETTITKICAEDSSSLRPQGVALLAQSATDAAA